MKTNIKKLASILLAFSLSLMLVLTAFAEYDEYYDYSAPASNGTNVNDDADLLTDDEEKALQATIDTIKSKYNFEVVLHTTNSIGTKTVADYADDYYDYNGFGIGENRDGMLFMLNMNNGEEGNRDFYTSTCGYGIQVFTDYAIADADSVINAAVLPFLSGGDYYGAFEAYLDYADIFLAQAATGDAYDINNEFSGSSDYAYEPSAKDYLEREVIVLVVAVLVALVVSMIFKSQMKTNVKKYSAGDYVVPNSLAITGSADMFVRKSVSRTAIPKETSSSGGSSTHSSSSGSSHGGGGGKF